MQCNCTTANRFSSNYIYADIAQLVVHRIRNPKVASSILAISSIKNNRLSRWGQPVLHLVALVHIIQQYLFQLILNSGQLLLGILPGNSALLLDFQGFRQGSYQILINLFYGFHIHNTAVIFLGCFNGIQL